MGVVHCKPTSGLQINPAAQTGVVVRAVHPGPVMREELGGHHVAEPHTLLFPHVEGENTTALLTPLVVLASVKEEKGLHTAGEMPWQVSE